MAIHGDKSQPERDWVLAGKVNVRMPLDQNLVHYLTLKTSLRK